MRYRILFLAALVLAMRSEAAAQDQATPELGLTLVGTAADNAGGGLAVIEQADGATQFLELGHEIAGYTVTRIEPARVVLTNADGEIITLQVPGADPGGPATGPARMTWQVNSTFYTASSFPVMVARDGLTVSRRPILVIETPTLYAPDRVFRTDPSAPDPNPQ
jgi:hypothetical protein